MSGGFRSRTSGRREHSSGKPKHDDQTTRRSGGKHARDRQGRPKHPNQGSKRHGKTGGGYQRGVDKQRHGVRIGDPAREVALTVLHRVATDEAYANLVLPALLRERRITGRDAAFATELTYGALRTQGVLDAVIAANSSRELAAIDPWVLAALRLGTYQLLYTRVSPHAAVDTSVQLVEAAGQGKAKGFTNGILRTIDRSTRQQWFDRLMPSDALEALAFEHAHPAWIARSFHTALGAHADELAAALEVDSQRPRVHLVARPGELTAEELALSTGGTQGRFSPYAVYLDEGDPGELGPVRDRIAAVQDEGSQLIARAVVEAPVSNDQGRWLDLCAGPGGKAALMGALARIDGASVDAVETSEHRADLVRKATDGLPVRLHTVDGRDPGLEPGFDRVLVDAPCSGLGALRRRPEARWTKDEADIAALTPLQGELLASAIRLARPGGVVVYSTCSPDVRETREIVDDALATGEVEELDASQFTCGMEDTGPERSVQMWPHRHGTDAMFFAVLRKK